MMGDLEELDYRNTRLGELILRRRRDPVLGAQVFEVKLNDEYLMSSAFTTAESELATLSLSLLAGADLDVLVGGLGLGYTAKAALDDSRVRSVTVIETLAEVIDWHERGLLPLGTALAGDPRCRLVHGDFFSAVAPASGEDPEIDGAFHVVMLDIDHAPDQLLHPSHGAFYSAGGLRQLAGRLHRAGVFGMWSNDPPDAGFQATLSSVFAAVDARVISFPNPYQQQDGSATIYLAQAA